MAERNPAYEAEMVSRAMTNAASQRQLSFNGTFLSDGPPTWVAAAFDGSHYPREAISLRLTDTPRASLRAARQRVRLSRDLGSCGAQVVAYTGEPHIIERPDAENGAYIAMSMEHLGESVSDFRYGQAVGSMHVASLYLRDIRDIPSLDQMASARDACNYVFEQGDVETGGVRFGKTIVQKVSGIITEGYQLQREMHELSHKRTRPDVILQEDTHPQQVAADQRTGVAKLLDVKPVRGPLEVDLARPLTDWHNRFGYDPQRVRHYLRGHLDHGMPPDREVQELANGVANIRFSLAMFVLAVRRHQLGFAGNEWLSNEALHRIAHVNERTVRWNAWDSSQKTANKVF